MKQAVIFGGSGFVGHHLARRLASAGCPDTCRALFERLGALGLKSPINRARVMKPIQSTNIGPAAPLDAGHSFETDLSKGLRRWKADGLAGELS